MKSTDSQQPFSIPIPQESESENRDDNHRLSIHPATKWLGQDTARRLGIFQLPENFLLSVVIPVFNEVNTIESVIERVRSSGLPIEIVLVDDGSRDGTREKLKSLEQQSDIRIILHEKNRGKGAALKTGFQHAKGDIVVIQDADMEYDPQDFRYLIQPIIEGEADVVYGTRYGHQDRPVAPLWHYAVNRFISFLTSIKTGLYLSDVETCYKLFPRKLIQDLVPNLKEDRFGFEIEVTVRLARQKIRFYERPIRFHRRSWDQGKKIGWKDGVRALWCIVRY
ncbi:MAG: Undecaprenyl-phosphate 4-deoxy-4-formamido-L-arabinose transferase [Planctomycetota bacterium]|jgi:glycosyltransferase involved in cell wall biosynthesis